MSEKKQRGGARPNSGPKPLRDKPNRKTLKLSDQTLEALMYYSKSIGMNPSDLADYVLFMHLAGNEDFLCCPKCKTPMFYKPVIPINGLSDFECQHCGYKFQQEL